MKKWEQSKQNEIHNLRIKNAKTTLGSKKMQNSLSNLLSKEKLDINQL